MDMKAFSDENVARCTAPNGFNHPLDSWTLSDWMVATMGELGEAANVLKKLNRVRDGIPGNSETPEQLKAMFADELADTYIYLDLMARAAGQEIVWRGVTETPNDLPMSERMSYAIAMLGHAASLLTYRRVTKNDHPAFREYLLEFCGMIEIVALAASIDFPKAIRDKFDRTSAKIGYVRIAASQPTGGRYPDEGTRFPDQDVG